MQGHGLHLGNVKQIADINNMNELNIGHSLIADALFHGLAQSIENMRAVMQGLNAMMPLGSGIDIVEIDRIKKILEKRYGGRFIEKILHEKEQAEYRAHQNQAAFLAKRFAVKEAMAKALGSGIGREIGFTDMYVEHDAVRQA
jgi:hypothetical protein